MPTLLYNAIKDSSTTPATYAPESVPRAELQLDDIASLINANDPSISVGLSKVVIVGLRDVFFHVLSWGNWGELEGFFEMSSEISTLLEEYSSDIDEDDFACIGSVFDSFQQEIIDSVVYELNDIIDPSIPYISTCYDSDYIQNYTGFLKGFYVVGERFNIDNDEPDEGIFFESVLGTRTKQERVSLSSESMYLVTSLPSIEGPADQNSVEFTLSVSLRLTPGDPVSTGTYGQPIRATNAIDKTYPKVLLSGLEDDNAELFIHDMLVGTVFTLYVVENGSDFDLYAVDSNGTEGDHVLVDSNGSYSVPVGDSGEIALRINNATNIYNKISLYKDLFFDVIQLDVLFPGISFQTINSGSSSFDPSITKSGAAVDWDLGDGTIISNSNSIDYSGYNDSSTKTVRIFNIDSIDNITEIFIYLDLMSGPFFDLSRFSSLTNFLCSANQITGSIPDLSSNVSLVIFNCRLNYITGSIPDLSSNVNMHTFSCASNQITGSIPDLSSNVNMHTFSCYSNQLTGSIPGLSNNVAMEDFRCYSNQITGYDGGLDSCVSLATFNASSNNLTVDAVSDIIDDLWVIRTQIGALGCTISIDGTGNASPDSDAVDKIEGTGSYSGDGLKDAGCTVVYN